VEDALPSLCHRPHQAGLGCSDQPLPLHHAPRFVPVSPVTVLTRKRNQATCKNQVVEEILSATTPPPVTRMVHHGGKPVVKIGREAAHPAVPR